SSQQEENHRQSGITKDSEGSVNPHQHRGADNQSSDHQTQRDSVCDLLKSFHYDLFVDRIYFETQLVVSRCIQDFIYAGRKFLYKLLQINDAGQKIIWSNALEDVALEYLVRAIANDDVRIEVRIKCIDHAVEV